MKTKPYSVLYIAGYGHSGTTILDLVFGSTQDAISCGELTHFTRQGFFEEYCSCHNQIKDCSFWKAVFENWQREMPCTFEEYMRLRNRYEGNKNFFKTAFNYLFPGKKFKLFSQCTELFYDEIHRASGKKVIVDSSKGSSRIFLLASFAPVSVIHVCRNFRGVLNSEQKDVKVDLENGIEAASPPKRFSRVLRDWVITNATCTVARLIFSGKKLHFKQWIQNPKSLVKYHTSLPDNFEKQAFKAPHMIAGNAIRMKPPQKLRRKTSFEYNRLTSSYSRFGLLIEWIFPFWS